MRRVNLSSKDQKAVAVALLEIYAFRASRDDEHLMSVGSFMLATADKLEDKKLSARVDRARCALERAAHRLPPDPKCTRALRALAPHLAELKVCEECNCWRNHTLACSKEREPASAEPSRERESASVEHPEVWDLASTRSVGEFFCWDAKSPVADPGPGAQGVVVVKTPFGRSAARYVRRAADVGGSWCFTLRSVGGSDPRKWRDEYRGAVELARRHGAEWIFSGQGMRRVPPARKE